MNVVQQPLGEQTAVLKVEVSKSDYQDKVKKTLNDYRRKANINGFRPGMAPMSMIQKMYGHSVLIDEINKLVSDALNDHITNEKLNILGEPIPYEEGQPPIDWENQEDFEFNYEIGISPEIEVKLSKRDKLPKYVISVSEEDKQRQLENIMQRYGKFVDAEEAGEDDLLKVDLTQEGENVLNVEDTYISLKVLTDAKLKKPFIGKKVGDVVKVDAKKTFTNEADLAALLKVKKEELENINPKFTATIKEVRHFENAELNQELFDKLYGEGVVTSEEEMMERIDGEIRRAYDEESEYKLLLDAKEKLIKKAKIDLAEDFLKRWLLIINEGKITQEQIDQEFEHFADDLRWQLIKDSIGKAQEIKIEEPDIMEHAKRMARYQFVQYGLNNMPDEHMENFAKRLLEDQKQLKGIVEKVYEDKVIGYVKNAVNLEEKEISIEDFGKLFEKK
ncbi:MAG: trigger factor [Prevotellaceae bacterium]|jgi:trigger factor|nr:trigger factor [Prevotellaceae bacterium]